MKLKKKTPAQPKLTEKQKRQQQFLSEASFDEESPLNIEAVLKKSFLRLDDSWQDLDAAKFSDIRLSDILTRRQRFVFQVEIGGDVWFVATHAADAKRLKAKHEDCKVISCESILSMFTPDTDFKEIEVDDFKNFLQVLSVFDAKCVDLKLKNSYL